MLAWPALCNASPRALSTAAAWPMNAGRAPPQKLPASTVDVAACWECPQHTAEYPVQHFPLFPSPTAGLALPCPFRAAVTSHLPCSALTCQRGLLCAHSSCLKLHHAYVCWHLVSHMQLYHIAWHQLPRWQVRYLHASGSGRERKGV